MPGQWGDHLGVVDLVVNNDDGAWKVVDATAHARPVYDKPNKKALVERDGDLAKLLNKNTKILVSLSENISVKHPKICTAT